MAGKGSAPRPIPNQESYSNNWDAIFGKKEDKQDKTKSPSGSKKKGK